VLVRVRAASLNPTDYVLMRGILRPQTGWRRPKQHVKGIDVAGVVEAVGADVADLTPGEAVYGVCRGSFAEYAVGVPERLLPKPERLSFDQAAAIAVAGTMALEALRDHAQLYAGQRIAITGATGGVGSFAVQIAKAYDAHVTAVCRTEGVELAGQLGADVTPVVHRTYPLDEAPAAMRFLMERHPRGKWSSLRSEKGVQVKITRNTHETAAGSSDWFTGSVYIDAVAAPSGSSQISAASVHFTPGARTAWHTHPNGQTIWVLDGVGLCSGGAARSR
jgi:Zn-dependent alcohol dehydrogenase